MGILMTYHTLVGRDTRFVSRKWQFVIIFLLMGIAVLSLVTGFKIHSLDDNYEENCFIYSTIVFKIKPDELHILNRFDDQTTLKPKTDSRALDYILIKEEDITFFERAEVDGIETLWGKQYNCIFISITPLFFCFCAIVWIAMFITCGHGGSGKSIVSEKPWKIVVPSLIFFILATIATFILLMFVKSVIDEFCEQLQKELVGDYYCGYLLEHFSLIGKDDRDFTPDCYAIIIRSLIVTNILWATAAAVMILRIIFVIDFQLIRVTISKVDDTFQNDDGIKEIPNDNNDGYDENYEGNEYVEEEDIDGEEELSNWLYENKPPPEK